MKAEREKHVIKITLSHKNIGMLQEHGVIYKDFFDGQDIFRVFVDVTPDDEHYEESSAS